MARMTLILCALVLCAGCAAPARINTDRLQARSDFALRALEEASVRVRAAGLTDEDEEQALERVADMRAAVLEFDLITARVSGVKLNDEQSSMIETLLLTMYRHVESVARLPAEALAREREPESASMKESMRRLEKTYDSIRDSL